MPHRSPSFRLPLQHSGAAGGVAGLSSFAASAVPFAAAGAGPNTSSAVSGFAFRAAASAASRSSRRAAVVASCNHTVSRARMAPPSFTAALRMPHRAQAADRAASVPSDRADRTDAALSAFGVSGLVSAFGAGLGPATGLTVSAGGVAALALALSWSWHCGLRQSPPVRNAGLHLPLHPMHTVTFDTGAVWASGLDFGASAFGVLSGLSVTDTGLPLARSNATVRKFSRAPATEPNSPSAFGDTPAAYRTSRACRM